LSSVPMARIACCSFMGLGGVAATALAASHLRPRGGTHGGAGSVVSPAARCWNDSTEPPPGAQPLEWTHTCGANGMRLGGRAT
jgi:hypothetical protein